MFTPVYSEEKNAEGGFDIVDVVDKGIEKALEILDI